MTEDELIAAITQISHPHANRRIVLGIGDDAALWQPSRSHRSAISTDMLVEGVHFTLEIMSLADSGWRAMAASLSDLAAMGARPVLATVALGLSPATVLVQVVELYRGLSACAQQAKTSVVGGDLSRANALTIAITVVGEVRASNAKTRSGGRAGDVLAVTGALGAARAGLEAAQRPESSAGELREMALRAFRRPQPRLAEGRFLAASRSVDAMMDCSDGLSTDLSRMCIASGCGATLSTIPVADCARRVGEEYRQNPERFALAGGEDFELLVAVRPRAFNHLSARYAARFGQPLLRIGTLTGGSEITWNGSPLERSGWDHFAQLSEFKRGE